MKLSQKVPDVLISEDFEQVTYSMDEESEHIVFDILRSKVYKNPKGSICREIASNCRDSHREANIDSTPIEIEIVRGDADFFNLDGLHIIFRDFGTGMSKETVQKVYSKFGGSTRRKTNKFTGGFGLGAKTPFSYVDAFTVVTVVDQVMYTYSMFIDASKKGKIALIDTTEVPGRANGTEVIIPIQPTDRRAFEREVIHSTYFWDVRPRLKNFQSIYPEILEGQLGGNKVQGRPGVYEIFDYGHFLEEYGAVIDGIYYPIDKALIGVNGSVSASVVFFFDNGDLELVASREQLQYDDETVKKLQDKVKIVQADVRAYYEQELGKCTKLYQAKLMMMKFRKEDLFPFVDEDDNPFSFTAPDGTITYLDSETSSGLKAHDIFVVTAAPTIAFRADLNSVLHLVSSKTAAALDDVYIITGGDRMERRFKMQSTISRTIINRNPNKNFLLIIEHSETDRTEETFNNDVESDMKMLSGHGIDVKRYWDVVPDKQLPPVRPKKETITLKTFYKGEFERKDYKYENGEFVSDKIFIKYYMDKEDSLTKNSDLASKLSATSALLFKIDARLMVVVSTRLKDKYFNGVETLQNFLAGDKNVKKYLLRFGLDSAIIRASSYSTLVFSSPIQSVINELIELRKIERLDLSLTESFIREVLPNLDLEIDSKYSDVFKEINKRYPLLKEFQSYSSQKKDYIALVNKLELYTEKFGEI